MAVYPYIDPEFIIWLKMGAAFIAGMGVHYVVFMISIRRT